MTGRPCVSVITPIFNAEQFLQEAIESVLAQRYEAWELLLINDGSTDSSPQIAQRYAARFPEKIRYLTHEANKNLGKSSSRNLGIRQARGEYLVFLDADDVLLPQKLAAQVALLEARPEAGMVYGRTIYWHEWQRVRSSSARDSVSHLGVRPQQMYHPPALLTRFLRNTGSVPCLCSPLVRRSLVLDVGLFEESIQHLFEDQVLLAKLCLAAPVYVDDGVYELYRQHDGSSSSVAKRAGEYQPWLPDPAHLRYLLWLREYVTQRRLSDTQLESALRRALQPYDSPRMNMMLLPMRYLSTQVVNQGSALWRKFHHY